MPVQTRVQCGLDLLQHRVDLGVERHRVAEIAVEPLDQQGSRAIRDVGDTGQRRIRDLQPIGQPLGLVDIGGLELAGVLGAHQLAGGLGDPVVAGRGLAGGRRDLLLAQPALGGRETRRQPQALGKVADSCGHAVIPQPAIDRRSSNSSLVIEIRRADTL